MWTRPSWPFFANTISPFAGRSVAGPCTRFPSKASRRATNPPAVAASTANASSPACTRRTRSRCTRRRDNSSNKPSPSTGRSAKWSRRLSSSSTFDIVPHLGVMQGERRHELRPRPCERALHGSFRDPERTRDLGGAHLEHVTQHGHLALSPGERLERPRHVQMVLARRGGPGGSFGGPPPGSALGHRPPPPAPREVQGHGGNPRGERSELFASFRSHPCADQRLLHGVLRCGVASGRKCHGVHQARVVAREEPADLCFVQS